MNIVFFTKYNRKGASTRYRTLQYLPYYQENGIMCKHYPLFDDHYLDLFYNNLRISKKLIFFFYWRRFLNLFQMGKYDLVVIEKELFPYFPPIAEIFLKMFGIKYILDYDDAIFHNYDLNKNRFVRLALKNKIPTVMKHASAIIAGSKYIRDFASKFNKTVFHIPTVVELKRFEKASDNLNSNSNFVIGWIGSKSTSKNILLILPALEYICNSNENIHVHLIGFDPQLEIHLKNIRYKLIKWDEQEEVKELSKFSVGIMPLNDEPWERGKCGFKLLQYMAAKKTVIASPVGANVDIVEDGVNGFFASNIEEWKNTLSKVFDKRQDLIELESAGYSKVETMFSVESNYEKYLDIFRKTK